MARSTASAKWAAGPALDGQRATPLGLGLNEGLGISFATESCGYALGYYFLQKFHTSGKLLPVHGLLCFRKSSLSDEFSESLHIFRKNDWIMKKFLMTLVAEDFRLPFYIPRADFKNPIRLRSPAVR